MKKVLFFIFFLAAITSQAQVLHPAKWEYELSTTEFKIGDEVDLIFKATIERDWHLYSSDFDPELGPMVTTFTFSPNDSYELIGGIKAINPKKDYDEIFEGDYTYFEGTGEFRQTIKVVSLDLNFKGFYEYQVCTTVDGRCIPFDEEFSQSNFGLKTGSKKKVK